MRQRRGLRAVDDPDPYLQSKLQAAFFITPDSVETTPDPAVRDPFHSAFALRIIGLGYQREHFRDRDFAWLRESIEND
ncbi:hypothetical protein QM565_02550 [Geitlerinema splendidum]|nr:hypothetical protein [Geitlerinema splendidum]